MRTRTACDTPGRMNTEYLWWILALILAGGGVVAFLAFGRVPEIGDEDVTGDETGDVTGDETGDEPEAAEAPADEAMPEAAADRVRTDPAG
jgi:hypothetical protein